MSGSVIWRVVSQHAGGGRSLLGAGELGRSRRLQTGDPRCPLDGIHLQLPEGGSGKGTNGRSASEPRMTVDKEEEKIEKPSLVLIEIREDFFSHLSFVGRKSFVVDQ